MNSHHLIRVVVLSLVLLRSFSSYAQLTTSQWSPLGALPMQYNGSFAGEAGGARLSSNFTFHPGSKYLPTHFYESYTSYDQFIPAIRSGIGITAGWASQLSSSSQFYNSNIKGNGYLLSVAIAPKFSLKGKYTLSPSLDFTYREGNIHYQYLPNLTEKSYRLQSRFGLLFNTSKYYIGYSVYVLDQLTFNDTTSNITIKGFRSYLQLGYTFQRSAQSKFSFTPQVVFRVVYTGFNKIKLNADVAAINLNFKYQQFICGFNNRGWHVGWQTEKIRVMLSNQFKSEYMGGYEGNLSFRYLIKNTSNRSPNLAPVY